MTREDPLLRLRLPEALKAKIQALAAQNRRSMNSEIVARLEESLETEGVPDFTKPSYADLEALTKLLQDHEKRIAAIEKRSPSK